MYTGLQTGEPVAVANKRRSAARLIDDVDIRNDFEHGTNVPLGLTVCLLDQADSAGRGCVSNETMSPVTAMRLCPLHGGAIHEGTHSLESEGSP